jgi:hypothetical protein
MLGEVAERFFEERPRPGKIRGRPRAAEEDGGIVTKAGPFHRGVKREVRQSLPEVVGERASGQGVVLLPQLLLGSEPVAVGRRRTGCKGGAEVSEEGGEMGRGQGFLGEGVGTGRGVTVGVRAGRS